MATGECHGGGNSEYIEVLHLVGVFMLPESLRASQENNIHKCLMDDISGKFSITDQTI